MRESRKMTPQELHEEGLRLISVNSWIPAIAFLLAAQYKPEKKAPEFGIPGYSPTRPPAYKLNQVPPVETPEQQARATDLEIALGMQRNEGEGAMDYIRRVEATYGYKGDAVRRNFEDRHDVVDNPREALYWEGRR